MNIALVNGQRQKSQPGLRGTCPECEQAVLARCGEVRAWHWAHGVGSNCDSRWANEGSWHRDWKNEFPAEWQEFPHVDAATGERHWADVQTERGWVLEFQHSPIEPEERRSRDAYYCPKLVWVVDGTARKRDKPQFLKAWEEGKPVGMNSPIRRVSIDECARLEEWVGSPAQVFFDFGDEQVLWWLLPKRSPNGQVCVRAFPRTDFVEAHLQTATPMGCSFDLLVNYHIRYVANCESPGSARPRIRPVIPVPAQPRVSLRGRRIAAVHRQMARQRKQARRRQQPRRRRGR